MEAQLGVSTQRRWRFGEPPVPTVHIVKRALPSLRCTGGTALRTASITSSARPALFAVTITCTSGLRVTRTRCRTNRLPGAAAGSRHCRARAPRATTAPSGARSSMLWTSTKNAWRRKAGHLPGSAGWRERRDGSEATVAERPNRLRDVERVGHRLRRTYLRIALGCDRCTGRNPGPRTPAKAHRCSSTCRSIRLYERRCASMSKRHPAPLCQSFKSIAQRRRGPSSMVGAEPVPVPARLVSRRCKASAAARRSVVDTTTRGK